MKNLFLVLVITLLIFSSSFSQNTDTSPRKEILMPIPSWIKEGTCVVYSMEVGSRVGIGAESSAGVASGYHIYIVTTIQNNRVYGITYNLLRDSRSGEWILNSNILLLNTPNAGLYLLPKVVEQVLKDREIYAQYGTIVEGGPIGKDLYYFAVTTQTQDEITTTSEQFTSEGIIQRSTFTRKNPQGGEAGRKTLVGIYNLSFPTNLNFPEIGKRNVSYALYSVIMGITQPLSNVNLRFLNIEGNIANYQISYYGRINQTSTVIGDKIFGPYYINPVLLKRKPIISIPQIGFSIDTAGYAQSGGILVVLSLSGTPISQQVYDPNTGLLLEFITPSAGFTTYGRLQN
ncbi:MAG: hypothetical protein ABDH25_01460 [Dictyoglomaceae bacterium]